MCGIFAILNNNHTYDKNYILEQFEKGKSRGPESSIFKYIDINASFGFHRLAINGLDDISEQPISLYNYTLICNGEIYNYKQLFEEIDITPSTNSDCEIIIHLYKLYGIEQTLRLLDGVFSFILIDKNDDLTPPQIISVRDPYGIRPLYVMYPDIEITREKLKLSLPHYEITDEPIIIFSSELKVLNNFYNKNNTSDSKLIKPLLFQSGEKFHQFKIEHVQSGTYSTLQHLHLFDNIWHFDQKKYYLFNTRIFIFRFIPKFSKYKCI